MVSPLFYIYSNGALEAYENAEMIGGVSLYTRNAAEAPR